MTLLQKLTRNDIDYYDVIREGSKYNIDFSLAKDFAHEKSLLKQAVLKELLKDTEDKEYELYLDMLKNTEEIIEVQDDQLNCTFTIPLTCMLMLSIVYIQN